MRYEEIAGDLQEQIKRGTLRPNDRLPSVRMLCRSYDVSQVTVEHALALLEKEALIRRSHRRGVFVAPPARKPVTGFIGFCGVSFTQSSFSAYWTRLMEGVEQAARACDARIVLLSTDSPSGWDKVDGLLVNPMHSNIPTKYVPAGVPLVSFFVVPTMTGSEAECARLAARASALKADEYGGMLAATRHLVALGHRRIAYLNNSTVDQLFFAQRLAGYRDALLEGGIAPRDEWLRPLPAPSPDLYFMNTGREGMRQWLREDWHRLGCTALLAHNDDVAWGAIEALREAGIDVPGQVSVVGFDGTEVAECSTPQLTTVEMPLQALGQTAVELLWQGIGGAEPAHDTVLPTVLRVRASTGPPAI